MFNLAKHQSVRGGPAFQAYMDFQRLLRECERRNEDLPPRARVLEAIKQMPGGNADLSITATSVTPVLSGSQKTQLSSPTVLGANLSAGQVVYADATTSNPAGQLKGCINNGTTAQRALVGILMNGGNAGQYAVYATGGQFNLNSVLTVALEYYMSANAGNICPVADVSSGREKISIIYGISATVAQILFNDYGTVP